MPFEGHTLFTHIDQPGPLYVHIVMSLFGQAVPGSYDLLSRVRLHPECITAAHESLCLLLLCLGSIYTLSLLMKQQHVGLLHHAEAAARETQSNC